MTDFYIVIRQDGDIELKEWNVTSMNENMKSLFDIAGSDFRAYKCDYLHPNLWMITKADAINNLEDVNAVASICFGIGEHGNSVSGDVALIRSAWDINQKIEKYVSINTDHLAIITPMLSRARQASKLFCPDDLWNY